MWSFSALFRGSFIFWTSLFLVTSASGSDDVTDTDNSYSANAAPGLKVRMSQNGFNYAANIAINTLSGRIQQLHIPDKSGSASSPVGHVDYTISNMKVTEFIKPSTNVGLGPTTGLIWSMFNAGVSIRGDWHVRYRIIFPIKDSGWFEGHVNGASISVSAIFGTSSSGQPTIQSTGCQCSISGINIKLHGGASWLYNLFMSRIAGGLRNDLQTMLCKVARQSIDADGSHVLASLKTKVKVGHYLILDYSLVSAPAYTPTYMDSFHKGEFFYVGDPSEAPFQPQRLPDTAPSRMIAFWISEYMLNTAVYAMNKHGRFIRTITRKDLPPTDQKMLDISCCSTCQCIGKLLPSEAAKRFPNSSAELELRTSAAPTATINASGLLVNITATTKIQARLDNGTLGYLLTLMVQAMSSAAPSFDGTALHIVIKSMSAKIAVVDSAIGPVDVERLRFIVNYIIQRQVVPKLNEALTPGIPLPRVDHVRFVNGGLQLQQSAICVYTDVQYVGDVLNVSSIDINQPELKNTEQSSSALKYQPLR